MNSNPFYPNLFTALNVDANFTFLLIYVVTLISLNRLIMEMSGKLTLNLVVINLLQREEF